MEVDKELGKDLDVKLSLVGGKVVLSVEFDGADAAIDALKAKVPSWLAPVLDLVKKEVDQL